MKRLRLLLFLLPAPTVAAPVLEEASLRFFEQPDGEILPVARRLYTTRFDATRMRRLGVEVAGSYAVPDAAATIALACTLRKPDGSVVEQERPMEFQFFAARTESRSAALLWGVADDRDWPPGSYAVECKAGEKPAGSASFEVRRNPPEVADGDIRVKALRVFPVAGKLPPIDARKYTSRLPAERLTRIGIEIEFVHAPLGREATVPVDCHFLWPDGQTSPPLVLSYEPQPSWAGGYSAGAMGFEEPGGWARGTYTVACSVFGQPAAIGRFEVG